MKMKKKFQVTITETDEGIHLSIIDFETKRKCDDLGKINPDTDIGRVCKTIIEQTQLALAIADLVIPEEK